QYTARRFDAETAGSTDEPSALYYYSARTYSPSFARFFQPDPLGYASGANLYAYVNNDPLDLTDPSGLFQVTIAAGTGYGGVLTFGYNSGQLNVGLYAGFVEGLGFTINPNTAPAAVYTGLSTAVIAGAGAGVGGVGLGANTQSWPGESGQEDKWIFCLTAARLPRIRRAHDETDTAEPHTGLQGEGCVGCDQG
ncbi:MAG TPA: RHS repeat-associated core domain-containing protein, partial [Candidatus Binataceae bacterium]|nr:RHS repeat-associated core domain-containing protein [Candidatus Binataceae bacterium]